MSKRTKAPVKKKPHPFDIAIGARIKQLRWIKGMTQEQLAKKIGCKFQQVQKYETGANRVSASRLFMIAKAFEISLYTLICDIEDPNARKSSDDRDVLALARSINKMNAEARNAFREIGKILAKAK